MIRERTPEELDEIWDGQKEDMIGHGMVAQAVEAERDRLRAALYETYMVLGEQRYNDPYVKSCRDNDLDIPPDCEHHVIVREDLYQKIRKAMDTP